MHIWVIIMSQHQRYTKQQLQYLRHRWVKVSARIGDLSSIVKANPNWEHSEKYKSIKSSMDPLPNGIKPLSRDLRGIQLREHDAESKRGKRQNYN